MNGTDGAIVRHCGDVAVIEAPRYINHEGGQAIRGACERLAAQGVREYVLNLTTCSLLNSVGISFLIDVVEESRRAGGHFAFCGASRTVARTLQIMGLLQAATIHDDEGEALRAAGERLRDGPQGR